MQKIQPAEIKDLVEYERQRDAMRAEIIELKRHRRLSVGENLTLLFENRATVVFQIQEMVRTERLVEAAKIQEEVDAYNELIPDAGELSATLFIEIPDIATLPPAEARAAVNRFQGIDSGCVFLQAGAHRALARFEGGHSKEEKLAAVQYLRFAIPNEMRAALEDPGVLARIAVQHPRYQAEGRIPADVRAELLRDLANGAG